MIVVLERRTHSGKMTLRSGLSSDDSQSAVTDRAASREGWGVVPPPLFTDCGRLQDRAGHPAACHR